MRLSLRVVLAKTLWIFAVKCLKTLACLVSWKTRKANEDARFGNSGEIGKSELLDAKVLVIPTNEEWVIAQQSVELL